MLKRSTKILLNNMDVTTTYNVSSVTHYIGVGGLKIYHVHKHP